MYVYFFNEVCIYFCVLRVSREHPLSGTPCMYINQATARVQPVKEFASRSIEHRAEKRLNAFTVRPSWEEGREGPTKKRRAAQNAYRSDPVRNVVTRSDTK